MLVTVNLKLQGNMNTPSSPVPVTIQKTLECFTGIQCWRLSALRVTAIVTVQYNEAPPVAQEATFV